jgi:hypothetical protein
MLNIFRPHRAWGNGLPSRGSRQLKITTRALKAQTRNVSFLQPNFTCEMDLIVFWYSPINSRLRSNNRFGFQGNTVRVNCMSRFSGKRKRLGVPAWQRGPVPKTGRRSLEAKHLRTRLELTMCTVSERRSFSCCVQPHPELVCVCNNRRLSVHLSHPNSQENS